MSYFPNPITPSGSTTSRLTRDLFGDIIHVKNFGAVADGVTNDAAAIQAALNYAASIGGGDVRLGNQHLINSTLTIGTSGVRLIAAGGGGGWHDSGPVGTSSTKLTWGGVSNGTMIQVTPSGTQRLEGCGVLNIYLDPGNGCAKGLSIISCANGDFNVAGHEFSVAIVETGCATTLSEASDCMRNRIYVSGRMHTSTGTILVVDGNSNANSCFNEITLHGNYNNGAGILLFNGDNNLFKIIQMYRLPGGTGTGIVLLGGSGTYYARANLFLMCSPGAGSVYAEGTENGKSLPSTGNKILFFDKENGPPDPVIGSGATLTWISNLSPGF